LPCNGCARIVELEDGTEIQTACVPFGEKITVCDTGETDAIEYECMPDGTFEEINVYPGRCLGETSGCEIPYDSKVWDTVTECEYDSGCGLLGRIGEAVGTIPTALLNKLLSLFGKEFKSRCQLCTEFYTDCKMFNCDLDRITCMNDGMPSFVCTFQEYICDATSQFLSIKVLYGEVIMWLLIVVVILIILQILNMLGIVGVSLFSLIRSRL